MKIGNSSRPSEKTLTIGIMIIADIAQPSFKSNRGGFSGSHLRSICTAIQPAKIPMAAPAKTSEGKCAIAVTLSNATTVEIAKNTHAQGHAARNTITADIAKAVAVSPDGKEL